MAVIKTWDANKQVYHYDYTGKDGEAFMEWMNRKKLTWNDINQDKKDKYYSNNYTSRNHR